MKFRSLCLSLMLLLVAVPTTTGLAAAPTVIDDVRLTKTMSEQLGKIADAKGAPEAKKLQEALLKAPKSAKLVLPVPPAEKGDYARLTSSVAILAPIYKCGKCAHWHLGGTATAWCLTTDGVFVTNFHCFQKAEGALMGIGFADGTVAAVKEILAADRTADVCLFRVEGKGFKPLALGEPATVGSKVRVISHPEGRFYFQSSGEVARYHRRPGRADGGASTWMSITADYAKGSSGGPVVDDAGHVVGMVSTTESIYYGSGGKDPKGPLQMVVKNCVPAEAIRGLTGN